MAIEINNLRSIQTYQTLSKQPESKHGQTDKTASERPDSAGAAEQSSISANQMTIRNERQASLVAHLFGNGASAASSSLKITYQAAIEKLNEVLSADLNTAEGAAAPISEEALKEQGGMEYWTPENTAKRIIEGSSAFLSGFQSAHPELEGEALIDRFMDVIGGGISQGFTEAKGILGDLDVLKGDIADNIESTYSLVQDGLQAFRNQYLGLPDTAATEQAVTDDQGKSKTTA